MGNVLYDLIMERATTHSFIQAFVVKKQLNPDEVQPRTFILIFPKDFLKYLL